MKYVFLSDFFFLITEVKHQILIVKSYIGISGIGKAKGSENLS